MKAAAEANPDRRIELWFMDEARVGQKGRVGFRWWARGERPRGLRQLGYEWAHLFGAVRPATGEGFALVLPEVSTAAMQAFLDRLAATLREDAHAALVLDGAGWHGARELVVPPNISLIPLPPYAPELNAMENVWEYLRGNRLSHKVWDAYDAILDACCDAWNSLAEEPQRLTSITNRSWAKAVIE